MQATIAIETETTHKAGAGTLGVQPEPASCTGNVWIDLDNSPHVPFFVPIIRELRKRGCNVILTARDCYQVTALVDLMKVECAVIGRHYGRNRLLKFAGTLLRAVQLRSFASAQRADIAVSHGSRAQQVAARILGIPCMQIGDYEHARELPFCHPKWSLTPELLVGGIWEGEELHYPGIKEDVYVPDFQPDPAIRRELGIASSELLVTIRPPASEAHYHNEQSDELFNAVVERLATEPSVRMLMLPRTDRQGNEIRATWNKLCSTQKILIPTRALDGLNLIWHSDLVISGGGTMNREAAALGVPVYSIFRGKIGAVDRYLSKEGRLTLIESVDDVHTKIRLMPRDWRTKPSCENQRALPSVVNHIMRALQTVQAI